MDNLKKYLQENKSKMDVDAPRDAVWDSIQLKTNTKKQQAVTVKIVVRYLAAASIFTAIVFGFKWMNGNKIVDNKHIASNIPVIKNNIDTSFLTPHNFPLKTKDIKNMEETHEQPIILVRNKKRKIRLEKQINPIIEQQNQAIDHLANGYAQMANMQLNRIRMTPVFAESPSYFNSFKTQLQQMDKDETEVRKFIKTNGLTDELLEQLINVAQQKLNLLKTLQTEIYKMNNQVKQNQSPADSIKSFYLHI